MQNNYTAGRKIVLVLLLSVAGCVMAERPATILQRTPSNQIVIETASKCDWLTIVGAGTLAFGVASYMAGSSTALTTIAAGVTLTTIGLLITMFLTTIVEYRNHFMVALIVLGIIAFFTFARSVADVNRDGKIDWQDLKCLLLKTKPKQNTT